MPSPRPRWDDRRRRNVIDGPTGPWVDHVTEPPVADPPAATRSPAGGKRTVLEPNPQERRLVIVGAQRILDAYDDGPTASTPKVDDSRRRRQDSALLALPLPVSGRQQELGELSARTGHLTSSPEREFRVQPKRREPGLQVFEGIERRTLNA